MFLRRQPRPVKEGDPVGVSKRQQTAAKRARELAIKERRVLKQQKKDEARRAKQEGSAASEPPTDTEAE
jgi:hypothetical protein